MNICACAQETFAKNEVITVVSGPWCKRCVTIAECSTLHLPMVIFMLSSCLFWGFGHFPGSIHAHILGRRPRVYHSTAGDMEKLAGSIGML